MFWSSTNGKRKKASKQKAFIANWFFFFLSDFNYISNPHKRECFVERVFTEWVKK